MVTGMPWDDYITAVGVNPSRLVKGLKSMLSFLNYSGTDKPDRGMLVGSLTHQMILEPGKFDERYAVFQGSRKTQKQLSEFEWRHEGKTPVKPEEYEQAARTAEAVLSDPIAGEILEATAHEVSLFLEDCGVQCKGRVDGIGSILMDVKTTTNVDQQAFGRVFGSLKYHCKLACYKRWAEMLGNPVSEVYVISVETKGDYDVAVVPIPEVVLENGWSRMEKVLRRIPECVRRDYWPGVAEGKRYELVMPNWSMDEEDLGLDWSE